MGLIHIYSHIDEEHKTYNVNGKIKNLFPEIDFSKYVILKNGYRIDSDYEVKDNDVIFARKIPSAASTIIAATVGFSILAAGVGVGLYFNSRRKYVEESQNALLNSKLNNSNSLPFLKGATNQSAQGRTFPFVIGKHYFTPYRLAPKYYSVSGTRGKNQYVYMILEAGFNELLIDSISLGNIPVYKKDSDFAQEGVFSFLENSTYFDNENLIEIRQHGDFENECFNKKIVSSYYNSEIKHNFNENAEKVVKQLESNSKGFDLCVLFNGLYKTGDDNKTTSQKVTLKVYYSNKESPNPDDLNDWTECVNDFIQYGLPLTVNCTGYFKSRIFQYGSKTKLKSESNIKSILAYTGTSWNGKDIFNGGWNWQSGSKLSADTVKNQDTIIIDNLGDITFSQTSGYYYRDVEFRYNWKKQDTQNIFSNTFEYNTTDSMRFIMHKDFAPSEALGKNISIMIERTTPKAESGANDSVYLNYINSYIYDANKSNETELIDAKPLEDEASGKCVKIGIKMKATDSNADLTDSFNIIASGFARVYEMNEESGNKEWTTWKELTSNPASWILDILTSKHHEHSRFEDSEIDLESFAALYEYCKENGIESNGVLIDSGTKISIIQDLLNICHASLFYNADGLLEIAIDKKENYPVALLNSQNVIDVTVTKDFGRKADGRKITFTNKESWSKESVYLMKDGTNNHTQDDIITEIAPSYINDYNQVIKFVHRDIAESLLQRKDIFVTVGKESAYYPLYSCVDVQLPQLQKGIVSSVINGINYSNGKIESITIAESFVADPSKKYGVIIQAQNNEGKNIFHAKCSVIADLTNTIYFNDLVDPEELSVLFEAGNIISFGELTESEDFDYVKTRYKIYGIEPSNNGYKLELKEYNEAIYEEGPIPEYKSTVAPKQINNPEKEFVSSVSQSEFTETKILQQNEIATVKTEMNEVKETVSKVDSKYYGPILTLAEIPQNPKQNDYFVWGGTSTEDFTKGQVYTAKYEEGIFSSWEVSTDEKQMSVALKDVFEYMDAETPNAFAIAFIQNLFANKIVVGEEIKSANYTEATYSNKGSGFILKADGSVEFNNIKINYTNIKADEKGNVSFGNSNLTNVGENSKFNIALGAGTLVNCEGEGNVALGFDSLVKAKGNLNIGIGFGALNDISGAAHEISGDSNIALGGSSGKNLTSGSNNVFIGAASGLALTTGSNNVYIGNGIFAKSSNERNEVNINNSIKYNSEFGFQYKDNEGNIKPIFKGYYCSSSYYTSSIAYGFNSVADGDILHVLFTEDIQDSNPDTHYFRFGVKKTINDTADLYPVKIYKDGVEINFPYYKLRNESKYNFLQAGTELDLMFVKNSVKGNYWLVLGNPLVHSYNYGQVSNFKVYANGYKKFHAEEQKTITSSAEQSVWAYSPVVFNDYMNKVVGVARRGYSSSTHYVIQKVYEYSKEFIQMNVILTSYSANNTITCIFDGEGY